MPKKSQQAEAVAEKVGDPTYTEAEHKGLVEAFNMLFTEAKFDGITGRDMQKKMKAFDHLNKHIQKVEGYIFELKRVRNK